MSKTSKNGLLVSALALVLAGTMSMASAANATTAASTAPAATSISTDITHDSIWQGVTFGQSTDANFATNVLPEKIGVNFTYLSDGTIATSEGKPIKFPFSVESRGGKIGNSHDGLTFYYTKLPTSKNFVLTATVKVDQFGPENGAKPAAQEGCGLLVRDILGLARSEEVKPGIEEFPASSNMVMTTVITQDRKDHEHVKVMQFNRSGVLYPWGNPGVDMERQVVADGLDLAQSNTFKLRLERTNEGFISSYAPEGSDDFKTYTTDQSNRVSKLDPDHYYVGFFASRNARMTVLDASLTTTEAQTVDTPAIVTPDPIYTQVLSSSYIAPEQKDYAFKARANSKGTFKVWAHGAEAEAQTIAVNAAAWAEASIALNGATTVHYSFTPDAANAANSAVNAANSAVNAANSAAAPEAKPYEGKVELKTNTLFGKDILIAGPQGQADGQGTEAAPLDVVTALSLVKEGGVVELLPGDYPLTVLDPSLSASDVRHMKTLRGSDKTVFHGLDLVASYLKLDGLTVTTKPLNVSGSYNHLWRVTAHHCDDTGIWVASPAQVGRALWASHNLIEECTSYLNQDPGNINADGFAVKMRVGAGNIVKKALSWGNADDGYDLFNKIEDGPNDPITIEDSVAMFNGNNGFKLGGEGLPVSSSVTRSISYHNGMDGFTDNFNPGKLTVSDNIAIDNDRFNFIFRHGPFVQDVSEQGTFTNDVSVRTKKGVYADVVNGNIKEGNVFMDTTAPNAEALGYTIQEHQKGEVPERHADGTFDRSFFYTKK